MINFEATELRLGIGLPVKITEVGSEQTTLTNNSSGSTALKRVFSETHVDLKLNLSSSKNSDSEYEDAVKNRETNVSKPPAKAQIVGWPPVRSSRKNLSSKNKVDEKEKASGGSAAFVKVSMDGAPYLRKVDLKLYKSYHELSDALGKMFSSFTIGNCGSQGMKDFMNESKLIDILNNSDYVPTYEDKDGDWMLVGDVPWEMFVESCKRLRIMKGSEAIGLAPRAVEKCRNRS